MARSRLTGWPATRATIPIKQHTMAYKPLSNRTLALAHTLALSDGSAYFTATQYLF